MKTKTMLAALIASLAAAVVPAVALADETSAVKADVAQLTSDVKAAHDTLIADLGAVTADAQKGDAAATKAGLGKFRSDRRSAFRTIRGDRHQLRGDLKAARDAKVDPATLKPILQAMHDQNKAALQDVHQAAEKARDAAKALIQSLKK